MFACKINYFKFFKINNIREFITEWVLRKDSDITAASGVLSRLTDDELQNRTSDHEEVIFELFTYVSFFKMSTDFSLNDHKSFSDC